MSHKRFVASRHLFFEELHVSFAKYVLLIGGVQVETFHNDP